MTTEFSLFDRWDEQPRDFQRIVLSLRKQSLEEGIDPGDFPEWLKSQGVWADGPMISIEDKLITFAALSRK